MVVRDDEPCEVGLRLLVERLKQDVISYFCRGMYLITTKLDCLLYSLEASLTFALHGGSAKTAIGPG